MAGAFLSLLFRQWGEQQLEGKGFLVQLVARRQSGAAAVGADPALRIIQAQHGIAAFLQLEVMRGGGQLLLGEGGGVEPERLRQGIGLQARPAGPVTRTNEQAQWLPFS